MKGVIFDLDGTLVDTIEDLKDSLNEVLIKYSLKTLNREETLARVGSGIRNLVYSSIESDKNISKEDLYKEFLKIYSINVVNKTIPYEGIIDTLKELKRRGYKLGIVSNKKNGLVKVIVNKFFKGIFSFYTGERRGYKLKPNPDLVELCLNKIECSKDETYYIGDSQVDYLTGHNSSLKTILVSYGFRSRKILEELNPKIIVDKPKEILNYLR